MSDIFYFNPVCQTGYDILICKLTISDMFS